MQTLNLTPISTGEPTYWPSNINKRPDLIDFAVFKGINADSIRIESFYGLTSDHSPIIITLNTAIEEKENSMYL